MSSSHPALIDGKYGFRDLVDNDQLLDMVENFTQLTGIVVGLVIYPEKKLITVNWREICEKFHRASSISKSYCEESDRALIKSLEKSNDAVIHRCKNGLVDGVLPIIIKGAHIASLLAGQVLFEKPDIEHFRKQAQDYGYDVDAYLEALGKVPVVTETEFRKALDFVREMVVLMAEHGYRNISLRNSQEELRKNEEQLSDALKMAHAGHWEYDVLNDTFTFNDNFYRIFRTTADEVGGYQMSSAEYAKRFCHPDDVQLVADEVRVVIQTDDPNFSRQIEHRIIYADGEVGHISVLSLIEKDSRGRTIRVYGVNQDITERIKAQEALRESEERLRLILDRSPFGVIIVGNDRKIRWVNQQVCELAGVTDRDQLCGKHCGEYFCPNEGLCPVLNLNQARDKSECILRRSNGEEITVLKSVVSTEIMGEPVLVETFIDITETKHLQELKSRAERLEMAGTVAGQVAHDFNNLLGPLVAYPELIREKLPRDHHVSDLLNQIELAAHRISEINQDLLAMGRRGHYSRDVLNLNTIINHVLKDLKPYPDTLFIESNLSDDLMNVRGGGAQLSRMLNNLLNNAVDAVQNVGKISVRSENYYVDDTSVDYGKIPKGEFVKLTISDTGCGIPDDIVQKIFDPFFTTKTTSKKRGSGLGMSVVDAVVKDHDGFLDLSTKIGEGTSFYIYFPVSRDSVAEKDIEEPPDGHETVLIVDDDEVQRKVTTQLLKALGYRVESVESGEKAVALLRESPKDLVVLDMVMPNGIDGTETYRRIIEFYPVQKAIILSGFSKSDRVLEAKRMGVGAFVKKPVTKKVLAKAVRAELDRTVKSLSS